MSIYLLDQALEPCSPPAVSSSAYHFCYDYSTLHDFKIKYPRAKAIGLTWLKSWTWHINCSGEANVRPSPFADKRVLWNSKPAISPSRELVSERYIGIGTIGLLFLLSAEDEKRILNDLGIDYVRQLRDVIVPAPPRGFPPLEGTSIQAYIHFDPRNTADSCKAVFNGEKHEGWASGIKLLLRWGAPKKYIQRIYRQLNGHIENAEPIFFSESRSPTISPQQRQQLRTPYNQPNLTGHSLLGDVSGTLTPNSSAPQIPPCSGKSTMRAYNSSTQPTSPSVGNTTMNQQSSPTPQTPVSSGNNTKRKQKRKSDQVEVDETLKRRRVL